jgi:hypothetical protein
VGARGSRFRPSRPTANHSDQRGAPRPYATVVASKQVEVHTYPILLQPGDELRMSPHGEPLKIGETSLLVWVDQAPGYRFAHPTCTVLIGAKEVAVLHDSWWIEINGRRFPAQDRQVPGLTSPVEFSGIAVHVVPDVVTPDDQLTDGEGAKLPIERESVVLWVDLHPEAKFAHATRYVILDASGGRVVDGKWWPSFGGRGRALGPALTNLPRWDLDVEVLAEPELPHETVSTVELVDIAPLKVDRKRATLSAVGTVPTSGWSDAKLVPHVYVMPPADGIWGVEFVARPPSGATARVVTDIAASMSLASLEGVAGFRVHARENSMTIRVPELHEGEFEPGDPFEVTDARFEADQLVIDVRYGGGCRAHEFHMLWSGAVRRSNPPQTSFFLVHDAHGDPCKAIKAETLRFDMLDLLPLVLYLSNGLGWETSLRYRLDD